MKENLRKEENFHDAWAESVDVSEVFVFESFEAVTSPENKFILRTLGDLKGKKLLDIGCGLGEASVYFALQGAEVTALDISQQMLEVSLQLAEKHGVTIKTVKSVAGELNFSDGTFDVVYTANLLHHVDVAQSIQEAKRVLKKGGHFASWDPLAYNPLINIYRRMATQVRTDDEHPLRISDLKLIKNSFSQTKFSYFWFFTLWIFIKFYLFDRIDPNQERYWKKILADHQKLSALYTRLHKIDRLVMKLLPFLKYWCWNVAIVAKK